MVDSAVLARFPGLHARLGQYKRAAIDAMMKSGGWTVEETQYTQNSTTSYYWADRPGPDGEGGGKGGWSNDLPQVGEDDYTESFDAVRARCDAIWDRWLSSNVDQASAEKAVNALAEAHAIIAAEGTVVDGNSEGTGTINVEFEDLEAIVAEHHVSGGLFDAFRKNFLFKLDDVTGNIDALLIKVGGAACAELAVWAEQKCTAVLLFENSLAKLEATRTSSSASWETFFKIAGWAVAGGAAFISGGASAALGLTSVAVSVGADVTKTSVPEPATEYESIMSTVEKAKSDLVTAIDTELAAIRDDCTAVADIGETGPHTKARYQIDDPATNEREGRLDITDGSQLSAGISFDLGKVSRIWTSVLPNVASSLGKTNAQFAKAEYPHDGFVCLGLPTAGDFGALSAYDNAVQLLIELVGLLKQDVTNAADNLELGVRDLNNQDAASQAALAALHNRIQHQEQHTPWDGGDNHHHQEGDEIHHPPPPTGHPYRGGPI